MRLSVVLMFLMVSLATSAPQFGFVNSFSPSQNCIEGNCQQNNQNLNFNSGFGDEGFGDGGFGDGDFGDRRFGVRRFAGVRENNFGPGQDCFGANCQQNNQNVNFNKK